jgi:uncharacterized Zn finger protein
MQQHAYRKVTSGRYNKKSVVYIIRKEMPMLMLQCKSCGIVFPGIYVNEGINDDSKTKILKSNKSHTCSRGHMNDYQSPDYMDWSGAEAF